MTVAEILQRLRDHTTELKAMGVERAALFGSIARGEAGPNSDIDIGVRIDPDAKLGVYEYVGVMHFLQDLFAVKVDVADLGALRPRIREAIEQDLIYAF